MIFILYMKMSDYSFGLIQWKKDGLGDNEFTIIRRKKIGESLNQKCLLCPMIDTEKNTIYHLYHNQQDFYACNDCLSKISNR